MSAAVLAFPRPSRVVGTDDPELVAFRDAVDGVRLARTADDEVAELDAWAALDAAWARLQRARGVR